jgi:hypothetical protein
LAPKTVAAFEVTAKEKSVREEREIGAYLHLALKENRREEYNGLVG